ncbi:MAG: ISKra4 family transposase [Planctomycetes bacterium]|nr:ISKra4 family transposase [Planctomycetota bacterium]
MDKAIESGELRVDEVERALFDKLLVIGRHLLHAFLVAAGDGDQGTTVEHEGKTLHRSEDQKTKAYRSIFGVLSLVRYVYASGQKKKAEWLPVDAKLGLPAGEQSYVLEDWMQRVCVKESFEEGVGSLRDLLGVKTSVRAAEVMTRHMAEYADGFSETQAAADANTEEEELIVLAADGKGVPMRRPLEERLQEQQATSAPDASLHHQHCAAENHPAEPKRKHLQRGEKRTRKQMAYVGAVYSIAPFVRTADQGVDELRRQQRQAERPRPQHKQVFAEMTRFHEGEVINGQVRRFARLAFLAIFRAACTKTLICLMDGQRPLWSLKESWFSRAIGILDIFHVMERLWQVAHAFHGDGTRPAELQVDRHLRLLLEGKVGSVIGLYKRMLGEHHLKGSQATAVRETITYFENNKQYMKYDEYLAQGFPIGTGVVEGACRHFVKDRMELAGMRWEIEGAQAMLSLRALYLNDQWDDFVEYRVQTEQQDLYAQAA